MSWVEALAAHAWTIVPTLQHRLRPRLPPLAQPWSTQLEDPRVGSITLHGSLREHPDAEACVLVVHGLGGGDNAHYCVLASLAADALGMSCLRLNMRGADQRGEDFYHAGLTADLNAALTSPELARYRKLYVLGYSLGGHLTLWLALQGVARDSRVRAVAAVCPPLDLERSARAIDRASATLYRSHVLAGLKRGYAAVAQRRPVPTPIAQVQAVRTIRMWDALTVVPRYGFESVEHYYKSMSVGPRLPELAVPALLVHVDGDPMIPPWTYEEHLQRPPSALSVHRLRVGGHVGFPARVILAEAPADLLERQILQWFSRQ